jgi:hypothetical protein
MARKAKAPSKLNVRLDAELRRHLEEAAARKGTSLQTEITTRLQASLGLDERQRELIETMQGSIKSMQGAMQGHVKLVEIVQDALQGVQGVMQGATQSQSELVDTVKATIQRTWRVWDLLEQRMTPEEKRELVDDPELVREVKEATLDGHGADTGLTRLPADGQKKR